MTTPMLGAASSASTQRPPAGRRPWQVVLVVLAIAVLVIATVAVQRSHAAADDESAGLARHQALTLSAYAGLQEAVVTWWDLPVDQREDALLLGSARVGDDVASDPSAPLVRTDVLRTSPDLALRLTVVSDGHRTVLWEKRLSYASDTCSTSDVMPSTIDCEAWALSPLA